MVVLLKLKTFTLFNDAKDAISFPAVLEINYSTANHIVGFSPLGIFNMKSQIK